jgi:hypothetical protein
MAGSLHLGASRRTDVSKRHVSYSSRAIGDVRR